MKITPGNLGGAIAGQIFAPNGRLEVLPAYYQTASDGAVQLDAANDGVNIKWTQFVDCELSSLSVYVTAVATQGDMAIKLYNITSGSAVLASDLGTLDCGDTADVWVRHTFTAVPLYRNQRYELRINGTDGDDFSLSARRWHTGLASHFPDYCSSETTTDNWSTPAALTQDSKDALLNIVLNSQANHVPQLCYGRYNGSMICCGTDGFQSIPEAGVFLDCSALTADTLYYVYCYMSSGTMTLEASTTGTAFSNGLEVQSGDTTKRYVGRIVPRTLISTYQGPVDVMDRRDVINAHNKLLKEVGKMCPHSSNIADADVATSWEKWNSDATDYRFYLLLDSPKKLTFDLSCQYLPSAASKDIRVGIGADGNSPDYIYRQVNRTYGGGLDIADTVFSVWLEAGSHYIDPYQKAGEAGQSVRYLNTTLEVAAHIVGLMEC